MIAFIIIVTGIIALTLAFTAGRKKNITVYNRLFIALLLLLLVYLLAK